MVRCFFVNAEERTIEEIVLDLSDLDQAADALGVEEVQVDDWSIWVKFVSVISGSESEVAYAGCGFWFGGRWYLGDGIVGMRNDEGEWFDVKMDASRVAGLVQFFTREVPEA